MIRYEMKKQTKNFISKSLYKILPSLNYMIAIDDLFLILWDSQESAGFLGEFFLTWQIILESEIPCFVDSDQILWENE